MILTTTKGTFTGDFAALAAHLAELVPSHADLDGVEVAVPTPADTDTDTEWLDRCLAAIREAYDRDT